MNSDNVAVTLEFSSDSVIIENNIITNMSHCVVFTPRPGSTITNFTMVGNLCTNVSKGAGSGSNAAFINAHAGQDNYSIDGFNLYNNTFLSDPANRPWFGIELGDPTTGTLKNINIKNNIIAHVYTGAITGGGSIMTNVNVSNNDIYDNVTSNDPDFGTAPTNYTYANNLHVDPLFVSSTDFHLQASSPAIDKGVDVGRAYTGTAPDIGYAER